MSYIWIVIIVIIIIIVCIIENQYYQYGSNKQLFKCPNKFEIYELNVNDKNLDNKILIYNTEIDKSKVNMGDYKYTYKPKILMTTRILKPFKDSINIFKHADKDTIVTDTVEGFLPYLNYVNFLLGAESKYKVLSNIPNLKITSNEDYIYIKIPDDNSEESDNDNG